MSYACVKGGKLCVGCMSCYIDVPEVTCDLCSVNVGNEEYYSDEDYDVLCERCLLERHLVQEVGYDVD